MTSCGRSHDRSGGRAAYHLVRGHSRRAVHAGRLADRKDEATPRLLGLTIFLLWIPVYRRPDQPAGQSEGAVHEIPAEGRFPVILVACHGLLAVTTLILVLLTALDVAG